MFYADTFFFGGIVLQKGGAQNHNVIMNPINSQIMSNEKHLDSCSIDSPRYEPSFELIAKIGFVLMGILH